MGVVTGHSCPGNSRLASSVLSDQEAPCCDDIVLSVLPQRPPSSATQRRHVYTSRQRHAPGLCPHELGNDVVEHTPLWRLLSVAVTLVFSFSFNVLASTDLSTCVCQRVVSNKPCPKTSDDLGLLPWHSMAASHPTLCSAQSSPDS